MKTPINNAEIDHPRSHQVIVPQPAKVARQLQTMQFDLRDPELTVRLMQRRQVS